MTTGERDERTGAELLREAAKLMRERANGAIQFRSEDFMPGDGEGPWDASPHGDVHGRDGFVWICDSAHGDLAEHIASWHPGVALVVAAWIDDIAETHTDAPEDYCGGGGDCTSWWCSTVDRALAVARAYLAAPASAGEPKENDHA